MQGWVYHAHEGLHEGQFMAGILDENHNHTCNRNVDSYSGVWTHSFWPTTSHCSNVNALKAEAP